MKVKSYKLNEEDLVKLTRAGGFSLWNHKRRHGQFKLRKGEVELTSVHHLTQKLLQGRNIYEHFLPKQEETWLMATLADDRKHVLHPYHALIEACRDYCMYVPAPDTSTMDHSWQRISAYVRGMDRINDGFKGHISYDMLITLRPYVYELLKELTAHIKY